MFRLARLATIRQNSSRYGYDKDEKSEDTQEDRLFIISVMSDPAPQREKSSKPPRRYWNAVEPFFDLRLSHWVQGFLALALLAVAAVQAAIYFTQAGIMRDQLTEMQNAGGDTKKAIEATNRFADAARDQVNLAKDTEQRQLRAYVHYRAGEIDLRSQTIYAAGLAVKNWGQTPAYHTLSWINADVREFPLQSALDLQEPEEIWSDVGPGAEINLSHVTQVALTPDDLAAIRARTKAIYVWGTVRYRDTFGSKHHTDFYFRNDDNEVSPGQWGLRTIRSDAN